MSAFTRFPSIDDGLTSEQRREINARALEITASLTLEEKIRQLDMYAGDSVLLNGELTEEMLESSLGALNVGSIHDFYPMTAAMTNTIQRWARDRTRNKVPVLFIEECLHGLNGAGHTIFPQAIANAATFDEQYVHEVGRAIGRETRAYGVHMCLAPVLDIARDPRWGRVEETYGEDTWLASRLAVAMVTGLQKRSLSGNESVIAEPKHFTAHGIPEGGRNAAPSHCGVRELHEVYLPVFQAAIQEAGARAVMSAYSEVDGVPCSGNPWLLSDVLRSQWGFEGFVLSDLGAISMLHTTHKVAETKAKAMQLFLEAGGNMQFYDFAHDQWNHELLKSVRSGDMSEDIIDARVLDLIRVKIMLGLFDDPFTDLDLVSKNVNSKENREVALRGARESICLLKNDKHELPLDLTQVRQIGVIGPSADVPRFGDYTDKEGIQSEIVTVLEGIKDLVQNSDHPGIPVAHAAGVGIRSNQESAVIRPSYFFTDRSLTVKGIRGSYYSNTEFRGEPMFSRTDLQLNFNWYKYGPRTDLVNQFSVRWVGILQASLPAQEVLGWFEAELDVDSLRVYVDDELLIDYLRPDKVDSDTIRSKSNFTFEHQRAYQLRVELSQQNSSSGFALKWNLYGEHGIEDAVRIARESSHVVLVLGEDENVCGETHDRSSLDLPGEQLRLLRAVRAAVPDKPLAVVLYNGRPLAVDWDAEGVSSLIEGWYGGQYQGVAMAEVLFGRYNPAGRLPISVPRSVGALPIFYNFKPSANRRAYWDTDPTPLFVFGHGLSYTTFEYSHAQISAVHGTVNDQFNVTVEVMNMGSCVGEEVVQMYIRDRFSSVSTPVLALKGFKRIKLEPTQKKLVTFTIIPSTHLQLFNARHDWVVEPGGFDVYIGASSADIRQTLSFTIIDTDLSTVVDRFVFDSR